MLQGRENFAHDKKLNLWNPGKKTILSGLNNFYGLWTSVRPLRSGKIDTPHHDRLFGRANRWARGFLERMK
jgi:hypothetical protein